MWRVICEYKDLYILKKNSKPIYYKKSEINKVPKYIKKTLSTEYLKVGLYDYLTDLEGNRIIKNKKVLGKPKYWKVNGQALYSGTLHPLIRKNITLIYHEYFKDAIIKAGLSKIEIPDDYGLKIALNIHEYRDKSGVIPDIDNLWPLEKWFTDSLVELGIIPDDSPKYVINNGEKCYKWIDNDQMRSLEFNITLIKC